MSDSDGRVATARGVVARSSRRREHAEIAELVAETGAERVVVGLPLSLDGSMGPAAEAVVDEVQALRTALTVPVDVHDERFTTVQADRALAGAGMGGRRRRRVIDETAAAVMLQSWLDMRKATHDG